MNKDEAKAKPSVRPSGDDAGTTKKKQKPGGNPYQVRVDYEQLELELIKLFGEQLKRAAKSKDFEKYMKRNKRIFLKKAADIIRRFGEKAQRDARKVLNDTYEQMAQNAAEEAYDALKEKREFKVKFGGTNMEKLKALNDELAFSLREANVAIMRVTADKYRNITEQTIRYYAGGMMNLEDAVFMGASELRKRGIQAIPYKNGKKVNSASYVEMAVRTANQRAKFYGEGELRERTGHFLVVVSTHISTCEKCAPWQGKILIDDTFSGPVPSDVMAKYAGKYATVSKAIEAGLEHPNCRHALSTYYPGISEITAKKPDEELRSEYYEAEVKQRALEREIRAARREQALAITQKQKDEAAADLQEAQDQLKDHLTKNPQLREIKWRVNVYL